MFSLSADVFIQAAAACLHLHVQQGAGQTLSQCGQKYVDMSVLHFRGKPLCQQNFNFIGFIVHLPYQ